MKYKKTLIFCLILCCALTVLAQAPADDPLDRAKRITACILALVDNIGPYVGLAFALMGGITYVSSMDDTEKMTMGKKFVIFGIVGIVLIKALVGIATIAPFSITPSMCPTYAGGPPSTSTPPASSYLIFPPNPSTLIPPHP